MNINLEKLKKQAYKLQIRDIGMFYKYSPARNIQHNNKSIRVNRVESLLVAQLIKLNSHLAKNIGLSSIEYDYFFNYKSGKTYIFCEFFPESKKKIYIPHFYNSIQGYEVFENIANAKGNKDDFLQDYLKQVLFAMFIGDPDRSVSNFISYLDDSENINLYPMFDFDECFNFGGREKEILGSNFYYNDEETEQTLKKINDSDCGRVHYTEDNLFQRDFLRLLKQELKLATETEYILDAPNIEDGLKNWWENTKYQRTTDFSTVFEFCYSKLKDKEFINKMLNYNLESLFDIQDSHGFNKRTKLLYLSLMGIQKEKFKKELSKLETKKII